MNKPKKELGSKDDRCPKCQGPLSVVSAKSLIPYLRLETLKIKLQTAVKVRYCRYAECQTTFYDLE